MRSIPMVAALALSMVAGCTGGGAGEQPGEVTFSLTGADNIQLFDATYTTYCQKNNDWSVVSAIVTIDEIDAKVNGQWVAIEKSPEQVDLLKLDNKTLSTLGIATIPAGKVSGLRLVINQLNDYVILKNGQQKPLTVPDNGIVNIDGKIDLDSCAMGTLILDFDPHISAFTHPGLHDYILSCTAKIKTKELKNGCSGSDDMAGSNQPPPDMAGAPADMTDLCHNVACQPGTACEPSTGMCVASCANVGCPNGQMCEIVNNQAVCK